MEKIYEDKINPFAIFRVERNLPYPIIATNMINVGLNIIYIKPDGALDDKPSILMILQDQQRNRYMSQVTLKTLKPLIKELLRLDKDVRDELLKN